MSSITLNTLKIAANKESSSNGFWMNAEAGWNDYDADQYEIEARATGPGSYSADQAYASKVTPSFEGIYSGTSGADAAKMKAFFKSIIRQGMNIPVTYDDNGFIATRQCKVAKVTIPHNAGKPGFKWAVDLISDDPYMYGPEKSTSTGLPKSGSGEVFPETYPINFGTPADLGRLSITNEGYAPSFPRVFEATGGFDSAGFSIVRIATGDRISLSRAIPVGSTVYIFPATGRVSIDGTDNDISGFLTRYDWWQTAPMTSEDIQFVANGTSTGTPILTARFSPAYY